MRHINHSLHSAALLLVGMTSNAFAANPQPEDSDALVKILQQYHKSPITIVLKQPISLPPKTRITIPKSIKLAFLAEGSLNLDNTSELHINGKIENPDNHCIFCGDGHIFFSTSHNSSISPAWFGVPNGELDIKNRAQIFLDSLSLSNATGHIPANFTLTSKSNLFLYGGGSLACDDSKTSVLQISGNLAEGLDKQFTYWLNLGIPGKLSTPIPWSGQINGCYITATPDARFTYAFFVHVANGFNISHNVFDWRPLKDNTLPMASVEGFNNTAWSKTLDYRLNGLISYNKVIHGQDDIGGEGLGMNTAKNITFDHNEIHGVGDDPIGAHGISGLTVTNNTLYSTDGRILYDNCSDVLIKDNYMERVPGGRSGKFYSGGGYIWGGIDDGLADYPQPTRVRIEGNTIRMPAGLLSNTYAIRILGNKDVIINNNTIINDSPNQNTLCISIEAQHYPKWNDPMNVEGDHIARPRNINVINNNCTGKYPMAIGQSGSGFNMIGPFTYKNNHASKYQIYGKEVTHDDIQTPSSP